MKIQPQFKYECIQFDGEDAERVVKFLELNDCRVIGTILEDVGAQDVLYTIEYNDFCLEPQSVCFGKNWYIWIDEMGAVNSARPEYVKENFKFII